MKSINEAMNVFGGGDVAISPRGSLNIGKIGMQRKKVVTVAGYGENKLQFKINPVDIFNKLNYGGHIFKKKEAE